MSDSQDPFRTPREAGAIASGQGVRLRMIPAILIQLLGFSCVSVGILAVVFSLDFSSAPGNETPMAETLLFLTLYFANGFAFIWSGRSIWRGAVLKGVALFCFAVFASFGFLFFFVI